MITDDRIQPTTFRIYLAAIMMLGSALLFPAVIFAASEPGKPAPTKQKENHNRLINESSPYLLQHATNPVNWYPWNEEAFEAAKREDKPIFLSIKSFSAEVEQHPAGHSQLMIALEFALNPNYEVVIVGTPQKKDTLSMLAALRKPFLPQKVVLFRPADHEAAAEVTDIAPFTLPMTAKNGQATAYVCQEFACKLPTTSIDQMLENLRPN